MTPRKEFTERDLSETPLERARREHAEYIERTRQIQAERDAYMNAPRANCLVRFKSDIEGPHPSWRPVCSLEAYTNGRSVAETVEAMKRAACARWTSAGRWDLLTLDGTEIRFLGVVSIPHKDDR